jgi:hypothetical protein
VRFVEAGDARGSLKWIRRAVNEFLDLINQRLRDALRLTQDVPITWACPLANDEFAEYRDGDFIRLCGVELPQRRLEEFWPIRGPQWDALARVGASGALLVEAKANIPEIVSPGSGAEGERRALLEKSLAELKSFWALTRIFRGAGSSTNTPTVSHTCIFSAKSTGRTLTWHLFISREIPMLTALQTLMSGKPR